MSIQQKERNAVKVKTKNSPFSSFQNWFIFILMFIVPIVSVTVYFAADGMVTKRKGEWSEKVGLHMENVVQSKIDALVFWFDSQSSLLNQLSLREDLRELVWENSRVDTFDILNGEKPEFYQSLLVGIDEFAEVYGMKSIYVMDVKGKILITSTDASPMVASQRATTKNASLYARNILGHARQYKRELVMDIAIPLMSVGENPKPVAMISAVIPADKAVKQIFKMDGLVGSSEKLELFQTTESKLYRVLEDGMVKFGSWSKEDEQSTLYGKSWIMKRNSPMNEVFSKSRTKFGGEGVLPNDLETIAVKKYVEGTPYVVLYTTRMKDALSFLQDYRRQIHIIAQLLTLAFISVAVAAWWRYRQKFFQNEMEGYKDIADELEAQKHLLDGVNNTVKELVTVKSMGGRYLYANPAFFTFVGKNENEVLEKTDVAIFGEAGAKPWLDLEKKAVKSNGTVYQEIVIKNGKKERLLEVSKTPIRDHIGKYSGVATVARDITEISKERKIEEEAHKQMIGVMLSVIERHDKHLLKNIKYIRRLVMALAEKMKLKKEDIMTLEIASSLCQIGKIYLPKELLSKTTMTAEDIEQYKEHIDHAAFILDCSDWRGLPVVRTVYEMYECLDGSGYPNGLQNGEISELARIMAVCNEFGEKVHPKPGHDPMTPEAAVRHLKEQSNKFDITYVAKLTELIVEDNEVLLGA